MICENIWKWYPARTGEHFGSDEKLKVLKGIDFSISNGDFVGILGASGVGKSSFLHLLGLIDTPSRG
ncbi:hypothetical protein DRQ33_05895, partial [bacterium]